MGFRRLGDKPPKVRLSSVTGSVQQSLVDATGGPHSPLENAVVTGWYPPASDPRWDEMKAVVNKYAFSDDRIDAADPGVQTTWIAFTVLKAVVDSLDGDVTANAVRRAIDNGLKISTGGLTPTLHWEFSNKRAGVGFPRLVNADMNLQVVKNGQLTGTRRDLIDVTKTLADAELD